jgi:hypothetical protein
MQYDKTLSYNQKSDHIYQYLLDEYKSNIKTYECLNEKHDNEISIIDKLQKTDTK